MSSLQRRGANVGTLEAVGALNRVVFIGCLLVRYACRCCFDWCHGLSGFSITSKVLVSMTNLWIEYLILESKATMYVCIMAPDFEQMSKISTLKQLREVTIQSFCFRFSLFEYLIFLLSVFLFSNKKRTSYLFLTCEIQRAPYKITFGANE